MAWRGWRGLAAQGDAAFRWAWPYVSAAVTFGLGSVVSAALYNAFDWFSTRGWAGVVAAMAAGLIVAGIIVIAAALILARRRRGPHRLAIAYDVFETPLAGRQVLTAIATIRNDGAAAHLAGTVQVVKADRRFRDAWPKPLHWAPPGDLSGVACGAGEERLATLLTCDLEQQDVRLWHFSKSGATTPFAADFRGDKSFALELAIVVKATEGEGAPPRIARWRAAVAIDYAKSPPTLAVKAARAP